MIDVYVERVTLVLSHGKLATRTTHVCVIELSTLFVTALLSCTCPEFTAFEFTYHMQPFVIELTIQGQLSGILLTFDCESINNLVPTPKCESRMEAFHQAMGCVRSVDDA